MRLASVLQKFSEYCNPRKNITLFCQIFSSTNNMKGKTSMTLSHNWKNFVRMWVRNSPWLFTKGYDCLWASICTRFQNTQNLEVKPSLKLQRKLENVSFAKILHEIQKTETESFSPDEYEFFLDTINV